MSAALALRVATEARLWSSAGLTATVKTISDLGVFAVIDGERAPVVVNREFWRLAATCDYCDQAAEVQLIDGQPEDVLCRQCAHGQFDRPRDWVRPIPPKVIRQMWRGCRELS